MKSRFEITNIIGWLIALMLMTTGFILGAIHKQSESIVSSKAGSAKLMASRSAALDRIALIHERLGDPSSEGPNHSEPDETRPSFAWNEAPSPAPELIRTDNYDVYINVNGQRLVYFFEQLGYTADKIDSGETLAIPPYLVVSLQKNWAESQATEFKESTIYLVLLPLILNENQAILRERAQLMEIIGMRNPDGKFTTAQSDWINRLSYRYRIIPNEVSGPPGVDQIRELLRRMDMVPPSIALAQAAYHSGYATSPPARQASALFGQWNWNEDAIRPARRKGNIGIRVFDQPASSVRAHIWHLNTDDNHAGFRQERETQRGVRTGRIVFDSEPLVDTLSNSVPRDAEYPKEIRVMIDQNRLTRADRVRLMEGDPIYFHR